MKMITVELWRKAVWSPANLPVGVWGWASCVRTTGRLYHMMWMEASAHRARAVNKAMSIKSTRRKKSTVCSSLSFVAKNPKFSQSLSFSGEKTEETCVKRCLI